VLSVEVTEYWDPVWFTLLFIACKSGNKKGNDVLNVVTINITYMCCLPDAIRRTVVW
jgi:hypothetical protein